MLTDHPKIVYHYTGENGMKGIIESQSLWATHYRYLNDTMELKMFVSALRGSFKEHRRRKISSLEKHFLFLISTLLGSPHGRALSEAYIVSFCDDEGDRLSQWRGYGQGGGYCIGFEYAGLEAMMEFELMEFRIDFADVAHVVYGDAGDVPDALLSDVLECMSLVRAWSKDKTSDLFGREDVLERLLPSFCRCMFRFKHEGFREEKEVRLVCGVPDAIGRKMDEKEFRRLKEIRFFQGIDGHVPYIKLTPESGLLPIVKIIVGPSTNSEFRQEAVRLMLAKKDMETGMVEVSKIPYRGKY